MANLGIPPFSQLPIPQHENIFGLKEINCYELAIYDELGSGANGIVFKAGYHGCLVAVKFLKLPSGHNLEYINSLRSQFWSENALVARAAHPNVVSLVGMVKDPLGAVIEFLEDGSLSSIINLGFLTEEQKIDIIADAASGLLHLHELGYAHFDVKPDNLLIDLSNPTKPVCKVSDFGLAMPSYQFGFVGRGRGTIRYMAPEVLNGGAVNGVVKYSITTKVDVYSLGIVLWQLLTGEMPFSDIRDDQVLGYEVGYNELKLDISRFADSWWGTLLGKCFEYDPNDRLDFITICELLRQKSNRFEMAQSCLTLLQLRGKLPYSQRFN